MILQPEALAVRCLQEYLLRKLPGAVATVNSQRQAVVKSALVGPFVVPANSTLTLATDRTADGTGSAITAGTRTAAQVAADITCAGITASADTDGRLVLTATAAPAEGAPSGVVVKAADWLGVFGWDIGGEHDVRAALTAPNRKGITDGWAQQPPDMGRTFWIVIGDRDSSPIAPDNRRDETQVLLGLEVWVPDRVGNQVRSKEQLGAALRAMREVLLTEEGRVLGAAAISAGVGILFTAIHRTRITGKAVQLSDSPGVLFDVAALTLSVKLFESAA